MSHDIRTRRRRPAPQAWAASRAGFSLLEVALVLAIIAVISAIAIPRYGSANQTFRLHAALDRVAEDLEFAQTLAKSKSTPVSVTFSSIEPRYWITLDPGGADQIVTDVSLDESPYFVDSTAASIGAGRILRFNGYGEPEDDANIEVSRGSRTGSLTYSKDSARSVITK